MCGIVGYVGDRDATPVLVNALRKLEYRGYDSAGIAVLGPDGLVVRKAKGALRRLEELIATETIRGSCGIGHTRWATHGEPSDVNSHPHTDVSGRIAVVHNGIIENHAKLRAWLEGRGVAFRSQTDTEVIAHLVDHHYEGDLLKAVVAVMGRIEGSYALAVVCEDEPGKIVAVRKDSPLVVGLGKAENLIASDVPALLEYTREVVYLEDKEIAVLTRDRVDFFDGAGERLSKKPSHVDWDVAAAEKGGFEHFMLKEIHEQPKALTDTFRARVDGDGKVNLSEIGLDESWARARRVVITACGTAWHAGVVAKYAFERIARIPVDVDIASEFRYRSPLFDPSDIFIIISQSGETADTLAAMRMARSSGARVIAITNVVGSTLAREADLVMYTWAGPEIAVASTKAFTTQLMCVYLIAIRLAALRGTLADADAARLVGELSRLPDSARAILDRQAEIQRFASQSFNKSKAFFMGRLFDYAISLESALKLKEISYTHSEAFAAGELKHGPIALVDDSTLVVAICTQRELFDKMDSNIKEVKARGATVLVVTFDGESYFDATADAVFRVPEAPGELTPILSVIPCQLYAYYCAIQRGLDPDKPRNLAKSVTVE
jgi:glucosamine--fructose-6-phosphate aminotransferase (isomerizing)